MLYVFKRSANRFAVQNTAKYFSGIPIFSYFIDIKFAFDASCCLVYFCAHERYSGFLVFFFFFYGPLTLKLSIVIKPDHSSSFSS